MQHTQNYQLPQWEKDDRILMEDFNDMTEKIDAGMAEKPYRSGHYDGSSQSIKFTLGFRPSAVLISRRFSTAVSGVDVGQGLTTLFVDGFQYSGTITFEDDGFTAVAQYSLSERIPTTNQEGFSYSYIAFR